MCMCIDNYNVHMYICICVRLCIDLWCKITWWSWQLQNHINIYMSFTITIYKDPSFPAKPLYSRIKTCSKQNKLTKTWITNHTIIKNTHAHTNTCVCVCARLRQEIVPEQWCCANRVTGIPHYGLRFGISQHSLHCSWYPPLCIWYGPTPDRIGSIRPASITAKLKPKREKDDSVFGLGYP